MKTTDWKFDFSSLPKWDNGDSINKKGNLIFLHPHLCNQATNTVKTPILIIDIEKSVFSYLDTVNYNPYYKVVELSDDVFGIAADGCPKKYDKGLSILSKQRIDTKCLKCYKLDDIDLMHKMIF